MDFLNPNGFWSRGNDGRIINQGFLFDPLTLTLSRRERVLIIEVPIILCRYRNKNEFCYSSTSIKSTF